MPSSRSAAPWSAPLADFVDAVMAPTLAKQGFGESTVVMHWDEIAGSRLAEISQPIRISWPVRAPSPDPDAPAQPATLVLRVESAFALEVQHLAPIILERVNAHLGWRCVGKIQIRQGPIERLDSKRPISRKPDHQSVLRAEEISSAIQEPGLRDAMVRLGAAILANKKQNESSQD